MNSFADSAPIIAGMASVQAEEDETFEAPSEENVEVGHLSDRGGSALLEESEIGRRRRRRRRRRGERPFGGSLSGDVPQPTDDGLAVVADFGGDLVVSTGDDDAFDQKGLRSGEERHRRSRGPRGGRNRFRQADGEATPETSAPGFDSAPSLALEEEFAGSEAGYSTPRRPAARSLMKRLQPCDRRSPTRRSMRSRRRRRLGPRPRSGALLLLRRQRPSPRRRRWLLLRQRPNRRARAVAAGGSARARVSSANRSSETHACVSDASSRRRLKTGSRLCPGGQTSSKRSSCYPQAGLAVANRLRRRSIIAVPRGVLALPAILRPPPRAGAPASQAPSENLFGSTAPGRRAKPVRLGALPRRRAQ